MKNFLTYTLATLTGIFLSTLLFFLLILILIAVSTAEKPVEVKSNTILYMEMQDRITDRSAETPLNFLPSQFPVVREMGLNDILNSISKAKKDDNIRGIYLELTTIAAGMGTTEEIRNALLDFKTSGKFVVAYADFFTQKSYYLASVADSIYMNPEGNFHFTGLSSQILFFKRAMDKLGIEAQVIRHGEYKSFVEPYSREKMSPQNREQTLVWIGSIWKHMLSGIGEQRRLDPGFLDRQANALSITMAGDALDYGLVDGLVYKDEMIEMLRNLSGSDRDKDPRMIRLRKYFKVPEKRDYKGIAHDKVAVIYASGDILLGNTGEGTISSERISKAIRKARRDSSIRAIVLRVNSGGGGVLASEVIWREVDLAANTKPLVASMGDVAASGGYYILSPADSILAQPTTVTGSIGVFAMLPNLQGFMNNKLGITVDVAKTNPHADMGTPFRPLTGDEKKVMQAMVDDTYNSFVAKVSEGRKMNRSEVDAIGGGHVWSGENALANGLIDRYGGLQDAIRTAASMAGLEKYRVVELPVLEDPLDQILRELSENTRAKIVRRELGQYYPYFRSLSEIKGAFGVQARLPFKFELY